METHNLIVDLETAENLAHFLNTVSDSSRDFFNDSKSFSESVNLIINRKWTEYYSDFDLNAKKETYDDWYIHLQSWQAVPKYIRDVIWKNRLKIIMKSNFNYADWQTISDSDWNIKIHVDIEKKILKINIGNLENQNYIIHNFDWHFYN